MRLADEYSPEIYIRLTKREGRPPSLGSGVDGAIHRISREGELGHSLHVGYIMDGWFFERPAVGSRMVFLRFRRNGVCRLGLFTSSVVTSISESEIRTQNSLYRVESRSFDE